VDTFSVPSFRNLLCAVNCALTFIRDNWLSNRVFDNIHALIDHCCDAWNKLEAQPWTIMSLGMRDWAYRF